MSKNNKNKTERYLMSLTKQRLVGMLMSDNTKLELLESNKNKDKRIAELEKELEDARLSADFYIKSSTGYTDEFNKLKHENFELEEELAELKENAIVPKFNFGDTIFAVVTYIDDPKDKTVIESGIIQKIECDKNQIKYWCDNGRIYWEDECEKLFATEQEAQAKLKELEERNEKVFI